MSYKAFAQMRADLLTKGDHPDPKVSRGHRTVKRHPNPKRQQALAGFVKKHGAGHGR